MLHYWNGIMFACGSFYVGPIPYKWEAEHLNNRCESKVTIFNRATNKTLVKIDSKSPVEIIEDFKEAMNYHEDTRKHKNDFIHNVTPERS